MSKIGYAFVFVFLAAFGWFPEGRGGEAETCSYGRRHLPTCLATPAAAAEEKPAVSSPTSGRRRWKIFTVLYLQNHASPFLSRWVGPVTPFSYFFPSSSYLWDFGERTRNGQEKGPPAQKRSLVPFPHAFAALPAVTDAARSAAVNLGHHHACTLSRTPTSAPHPWLPTRSGLRLSLLDATSDVHSFARQIFVLRFIPPRDSLCPTHCNHKWTGIQRKKKYYFLKILNGKKGDRFLSATRL